MKENEQQFTDIVRRNRSTIYTVCYMFSKDNDEVALYIISFIPLPYYGYLSVQRYTFIFKNNSFLRRIFILSVQNYHILLFYCLKRVPDLLAIAFTYVRIHMA